MLQKILGLESFMQKRREDVTVFLGKFVVSLYRKFRTGILLRFRNFPVCEIFMDK